MAVPGDDESRRTPLHAGPDDPISTAILAARRGRARFRIRAQDEHRRVCGELEELASLATYYGPRCPRPVPLAQFLLEGWWAA